MIRDRGNSRDHGAGKGGATLLLFVLLIIVGVVVWKAANSGRFSWSGGGKQLTLSEARATANPVPDSPAVQAEAKQLYADLCAHCHGDSGAGDGGEAQMYTPPPADFTRPAMANIRDGELFYRITAGRKPMPSFRTTLTADQRWKLVRYIRTFAAQAAPQKQE
jgi:mono/diheme cytochrome c family protein